MLVCILGDPDSLFETGSRFLDNTGEERFLTLLVYWRFCSLLLFVDLLLLFVVVAFFELSLEFVLLCKAGLERFLWPTYPVLSIVFLPSLLACDFCCLLSVWVWLPLLSFWNRPDGDLLLSFLWLIYVPECVLGLWNVKLSLSLRFWGLSWRVRLSVFFRSSFLFLRSFLILWPDVFLCWLVCLLGGLKFECLLLSDILTIQQLVFHKTE